jgi:Xaa-Pro aminopeptidase
MLNICHQAFFSVGVAMNSLSLSPVEAQKKLRIEMKRLNIDVLWITSFDAFLSEYTPKVECHRSLLTGFTGSVAEALIDHDNVFLFVDGRYFEQADRECLVHEVTVVKVPYGTPLQQALEEQLQNYSAQQTFGVESQRTPWLAFDQLSRQRNILAVDEREWSQVLGYQDLKASSIVNELPLNHAGLSRLDKWAIIPKDKALFVSTLDSLSWFLNARSLHRPYQLTVKGLALVTNNCALVMTGSETPWQEQWKDYPELEFVSVDLNDQQVLHTAMSDFIGRHQITTVQASMPSITVFQHELVQSLGHVELLDYPLWNYQFKKNQQELDGFRASFLKASQVISKSLLRSAKALLDGAILSEWDVREDLESEYKKMGAQCLSFRTIAGVGENGSVIHYGASSKDRLIKESELVLVDSGAYFEAGVATDTTRTFLSFSKALPWQQEIYTAVLKGLIQLSMARFPIGILGEELDDLTRAPIKAKGYNYAHGTGHGVGILVHEGGYRIAPQSKVPIVIDTVGSLEPGIYLPGRGGVRLENIAIVRECADKKGYAEFETLTYVGFDHRLIINEELSADEKTWLENYEKRCTELGTSFSI